MLKTRIITALLAIPAILICTALGGIPFLIFILALVLAGLSEFNKLVLKAGFKNPLQLAFGGGLLFSLTYYSFPQIINIVVFLYVLICFSYYLYHQATFTAVDLALTLLAVIYVSWGFSHLLLLRAMDHGLWLVLYVFLIAWTTDAGAYFVGSRLGKHKLAPGISPNKTWEGFIGGLLVSTGIAFLLTLLIPVLPQELSRLLVLLAPFVSVGSQMGDLFESSIKRFAQAKDSGDLIPGHGGVLDRFDSILWAAPLTYYLLIIIMR